MQSVSWVYASNSETYVKPDQIFDVVYLWVFILEAVFTRNYASHVLR
jgi:hypothetical protein